MNWLPKVGAVAELWIIMLVTPSLALVISAVIFPVSGVARVPYTLSVEKDIAVPVVDGDSIDNFKFKSKTPPSAVNALFGVPFGVLNPYEFVIPFK